MITVNLLPSLTAYAEGVKCLVKCKICIRHTHALLIGVSTYCDYTYCVLR